MPRSVSSEGPITDFERNKFERGFLLFGAVGCVVIGIAILVWFIAKVSQSHNIPKHGHVLEFTHWGAFGDFIAGVIGTCFSLAGIFSLYLTLKDQRESFHLERLENKFFELIKFHRDNVNELEYAYYDVSNEKTTATKRKVFKLVFEQFKEAWKELGFLFTDATVLDIHLPSYSEALHNNRIISKRKIDLKQLAQIDIIYAIVYFGLSAEDKDAIRKLFLDKYNCEFINKILDYASLKPRRDSKHWEIWQKANRFPKRHIYFEDILGLRLDNNYKRSAGPWVVLNGNEHILFEPYYNDDYFKYYGGHQFRLGHYFRHLYQSVKFIHDENKISVSQKYRYVKILRGQLSNYEQHILFLNSLSALGRKWELNYFEISPQASPTVIEGLITDYNLIKNIPTDLIQDEVKIDKYYPKVRFETVN